MSNSSANKKVPFNGILSNDLIGSYLSQITTFTLLLFVIPITLLLVSVVVITLYSSHTQSLKDLIEIASNLILPLISLFSAIISAIAAYFLINQFKAQTEMNGSQIEMNNQLIDDLKIKMREDKFTHSLSLLNSIEEDFQLVNSKSLGWNENQLRDYVNESLSNGDIDGNQLSEVIIRLLMDFTNDNKGNIIPYFIFIHEIQEKYLKELCDLIADLNDVLIFISDNVVHLNNYEKSKLNRKIFGIAEYVRSTTLIGHLIHKNLRSFVMNQEGVRNVNNKFMLDENYQLTSLKIGGDNEYPFHSVMYRIDKILKHFLNPLEKNHWDLIQKGLFIKPSDSLSITYNFYEFFNDLARQIEGDAYSTSFTSYLKFEDEELAPDKICS